MKVLRKNVIDVTFLIKKNIIVNVVWNLKNIYCDVFKLKSVITFHIRFWCDSCESIVKNIIFGMNIGRINDDKKKRIKNEWRNNIFIE